MTLKVFFKELISKNLRDLLHLRGKKQPQIKGLK